MKAIEILRAACYNSCVAENGEVFTYNSDSHSVYMWGHILFGEGSKLKSGALSDGDYFYIHSDYGNEVYPFQRINKPDVEFTDARGKDVWLWRVE